MNADKLISAVGNHAGFCYLPGTPREGCPYYIYYTKPRPFGAAVFSILLPGKSLANLLE
jgi:hypothetical protein